MKLEEYIDLLDNRKPSIENPVKGLGQSVKAKLKNKAAQKNGEITHLYLPEGSSEKAESLKSKVQEKFGMETPKELIGFYELFDGFELRSNKGKGAGEEVELEEFPKRLTIPSAKGILYYGETVEAIDDGAKTIIPSSELLFSDANRPPDNYHEIDLYYFDYFSSFHQIMIGIEKKKMALYQVKYGIAELQKIKEDFRMYFKKNMIRG